MKNKILVVFNICGIKGRINTDYYISAINSILDQDFDGFHVTLSSCKSSPIELNKLKKIFGDRISYYITDELRTVNVTFNHAVIKTVENLGEFDGYLYVDSGIHFQNQKNILQQIYNLYKSGPYGMVTVSASNDTGFPEWLPFAQPPKEDYIIPVGRACNLHCQLFSNELYKEFYKIIPDIFVAYCTESVFSFYCAAIKTKWIILGNYIVYHDKGIDGATAGFDHTGPKGRNWDNLFEGSVLDWKNDPRAQANGFGFEEMQGIFYHNKSQYDENGFCINEDLKEYIKEKLYMKLDYSTIEHKFIVGKNE